MTYELQSTEHEEGVKENLDYWFGFWFAFPSFFFTDGTTPLAMLSLSAMMGVVSVGLWWALLYLGFWIARGFVDDDDKKAGF